MFPDFESKSARLYERACKVMPGGNTRTSLFWPPYQIYADRGSGSSIVDVDGTERTDFHYNRNNVVVFQMDYTDFSLSNKPHHTFSFIHNSIFDISDTGLCLTRTFTVEK